MFLFGQKPVVEQVKTQVWDGFTRDHNKLKVEFKAIKMSKTKIAFWKRAIKAPNITFLWFIFLRINKKCEYAFFHVRAVNRPALHK